MPWLAEGHTVSTDGKTWTFTFREGVKFSDGKPVTAADVVFSIHRAATDQTGPLSFLDFAIKSLKATNARTVTFQLSQPWAPFLSDISVFANAILPRTSAARASQRSSPTPSAPALSRSSSSSRVATRPGAQSELLAAG